MSTTWSQNGHLHYFKVYFRALNERNLVMYITDLLLQVTSYHIINELTITNVDSMLFPKTAIQLD